MTVTSTGDGPLLTIVLDGPLNADQTPDLIAAVENGQLQGKSHFLLNLQKVQRADSAGLEALVGLARRISDIKGRIALVNVNDTMSQILQTTRLDRRLAIFASTDQALHSLRVEI